MYTYMLSMLVWCIIGIVIQFCLKSEEPEKKKEEIDQPKNDQKETKQDEVHKETKQEEVHKETKEDDVKK